MKINGRYNVEDYAYFSNGSYLKDGIKEKNDSENLFDGILFYRQLKILLSEQLEITQELERLLQEDQTKFAEYLSHTISFCEMDCDLNLDDFDEPRPESPDDVLIDNYTTLTQYAESKRVIILTYLNDIEKLWNNKKVEEIKALLKETFKMNVSEIGNAKKRVEYNFTLLENLTMDVIKDSSDVEKKELLKKSLENMRNDLKKKGFDV